MRRGLLLSVGGVGSLVASIIACSKAQCDDFATLSFDVAAHVSDSCALVLAAPSASVEYDFPAPTRATSCDAGTCTRSTCTTDAGLAPSFCARTYDMLHDRIVVQLEGDALSAFVARVGSRNFTATLQCGGAVVVDHEAHAVDCIADSIQ